MSAAAALAKLGISMEEARQWIMDHLNTPGLILSAAVSHGLHSDDLAEIVQPDFPGVTDVEVEDFFSSRGLKIGHLKRAAKGKDKDKDKDEDDIEDEQDDETPGDGTGGDDSSGADDSTGGDDPTGGDENPENDTPEGNGQSSDDGTADDGEGPGEEDDAEETPEGSDSANDLAFFSEEMTAFANHILGLNEEDGVLSTEALRTEVIAQTSESDYNAFFNPASYTGSEDGTFSASDLGVEGFEEIDATQETLESLYYGTFINAFNAVDQDELGDLTELTETLADSADDLSPDELETLLNELIGIFEDPAETPLLGEEVLGDQIVDITVQLVGVASDGLDGNLFDGLLSLG